MEKTKVYVVSSLREYGNGEQYFGADGIFRTRQEAVEYIDGDVHETLMDFADTFDEQVPESSIDRVGDDYSDVRISCGDKYFAWRIDEFFQNNLRWKYGSKENV